MASETYPGGWVLLGLGAVAIGLVSWLIYTHLQPESSTYMAPTYYH